MSSSGARLRDDDGVAMVVAMGALLVMLLLAGLAFDASTRSSASATRDVRAKHALQAAEAGLQTAVYRMNLLGPSAQACPAPNGTVAAPTAGLCPPQGGTLGDGATFSYRTSVGLESADACAGRPVHAKTTLAQRCVTSVGTVDGVTRRVQARVAAYASTPLFPVAGILGLDGVSISGNVSAPKTAVGSNMTVDINGNVTVGSVVLPKDATLQRTGNVTAPLATPRMPDPYVLTQPDTGNTATDNRNARIANGARRPPVQPYDQVESSSTTAVQYDPVTRALRISGNATLTLGGGNYNFCSVEVTGNVHINVRAGEKTAIYVDSPENPDSGCPPGTGTFSVAGNFDGGNPADPTALQLYVYGRNDARDGVVIRGNSILYAAIYAPKSTVSIAGNALIVGGLAAQRVEMAGNGLQWSDSAGTLRTGNSGTFYRTAWQECSSRPPVAADPASGC
jgi:Tfp pilus assembly protein PilX